MNFRNWKSYLALSPRIVVWAFKGNLQDRLRSMREEDVLSRSGLFDAGFYLRHHGLSGEAERNPIRHYLEQGAAQGLNPNPLFDGAWYRAENPDVAAAGFNPFLHFILHGVRDERSPHPLFDTARYLADNPDVRATGVNPLLHYLQTGSNEARNPHPLFDNGRYLAQNIDVAAQGANPLVHYLYDGWREDRDPHELFDNSYYLEQLPELVALGANPLVHFVTQGGKENRNPNAVFDCAQYRRLYRDMPNDANPLLYFLQNGAPRDLDPEYVLLATSGLFDERFYVATYKLAGKAATDPIGHYLDHGAAQGLNPHPLFATAWYLAQNPDVESGGTNPLSHFLRTAWREARNPHPLFDMGKYLAENPELRETDINPLVHYLENGGIKSTDPHTLFDNRCYLARNPDVATLQHNPLVHYLCDGWREDRDPHALFDNSFYLAQHPSLLDDNENPLVDFVTGGFKHNRNPNCLFDCAYYRARYADISHSANPLEHYLLIGGADMRAPHLLFDPHFYRWQMQGQVESNPLIHYFEIGVRKRLSPHILFDADYYAEQSPISSAGGDSPVEHYLREGAKLGLDPCELFDTSFYQDKYGDALQPDENPLLHFLRAGGRGFDPNPLFDTAFYLKNSPDVAATGLNPLVHYIQSGASEGRAPSPFFDSHFYLRQDPKLRNSGVNPLAHYLVRGGAEEGRDPSPSFKTASYLREHPEIQGLGVNPLLHFLDPVLRAANGGGQQAAEALKQAEVSLRFRFLNGLAAASASSKSKATVICVSHVSPHAPRAGNEYRINRLLRWLRSSGFEVIPVVSPLPGVTFADQDVMELAGQFGNAVLCRRDGLSVALVGTNDRRALESLEGATVGDSSEPPDRKLLRVERVFCHAALMEVVKALAAVHEPCIVVAQYAFMSSILPQLPSRVLKVIDTHDVFSYKQHKVAAYGVEDGLALSPAEESELLARADLVLAIQPEECVELQKLRGPGGQVITVGVDFPVTKHPVLTQKPVVAFVGSDNRMNAHGLRDFLRFAWPGVLASVPDAEFWIAGAVCQTVHMKPPHVKLLGALQDLSPVYAGARVIVNPVVAGTGLKVKTLEALSFLRPLVTWPSGTDGLSRELASVCHVATDWREFQKSVTRLLQASSDTSFTDAQAEATEQILSSEHTCRALQQEVENYLLTRAACN